MIAVPFGAYTIYEPKWTQDLQKATALGLWDFVTVLRGHICGVYLTACLSLISMSPNIKGDAEPVSRAKWEWCELMQSSGLPGGGDTEADVTASLNRSRERENRDRQFGQHWDWRFD